MKTVVSNSNGNNILKFSEFCDLAIAEENCKKDSSKVSGVSSNLAVIKGKGKIDSENEGSSTSKKKWKNMNKEIWCFYCRKKSHFKNQCRKLEDDQHKKQQTNLVEIDDEISDVCVCVDSNTKNSSHSSQWIVDSAASVHRTSNQSLFTSFISGHHGQGRIGNGRVSKIIGIGDINLKTMCLQCVSGVCAYACVFVCPCL